MSVVLIAMESDPGLRHDHGALRELPSAVRRESLAIGDAVKLLVRVGDCVQRVWVVVRGKVGGVYEGELLSRVIGQEEFRVTYFEAGHVVYVLEEPPRESWEELGRGKAKVLKKGSPETSALLPETTTAVRETGTAVYETVPLPSGYGEGTEASVTATEIVESSGE